MRFYFATQAGINKRAREKRPVTPFQFRYQYLISKFAFNQLCNKVRQGEYGGPDGGELEEAKGRPYEPEKDK